MKIISNSKLLPLIFILCFILTNCFYTQISANSRDKCFIITTFPNQNILVNIKIPTIKDPIKIQIEAYLKNKQQRIFSKVVTKAQDKITILASVIQNGVKSTMPTQIKQAHVCINTMISSNNQQDIERIKNKKYLIWLTIQNNFIKHIQSAQSVDNKQLQQQQEQQEKPEKTTLQVMSQKIQRMKALYEQQISKFSDKFKKDQINEQLLQIIAKQMYIFAGVEAVVILCTTIFYIIMISKIIL